MGPTRSINVVASPRQYAMTIKEMECTVTVSSKGGLRIYTLVYSSIILTTLQWQPLGQADSRAQTSCPGEYLLYTYLPG